MAATRHTSQRITLLMLVLASITILTLDYHGEASRAITHVRNGVADALAPIQRGVAATVHPLGDTVSAVFHYGQVQSQNAALRSEVGTLSREVVSSQYAEKLERQIATLSSLPFAGNIPAVPAEVISRATSNLEFTVEIDRGTSSGVGTGMPVVGDRGLIGSVVAASASTATVLLISDPHAAPVGVEDQATGNEFQVEGTGEGKPLALSQYGSNSGTVTTGTELETAGQTDGSPSSEYPAGIPVGVVATVQNSPGGLQLSGTVTPIVDTSTLSYVAVLQWLPPA